MRTLGETSRFCSSRGSFGWPGRFFLLLHVPTSSDPRQLACRFGAFAPVLILYLRHIGFSDRAVGLFLSATLLGDVALSLFVTWTADALGRRRMLALGSTLMAMSGLVFYSSRNYVLLLLAAIVGIISPSGNETGPFAALEQAMMSQLTVPEGRVSLLMWYQVRVHGRKISLRGLLSDCDDSGRF